MGKKHHHSGKSSGRYFDYNKLISELGLNNLSIENFIDIGCGNGDFAYAISKAGIANKIYALDIHNESIEQLKNRILKDNIQNIIPILSDFSKPTEMKSNFFNVATMINVMHGFYANNEIDDVITELKRILKENGIIIIVDFKKYFFIPGPKISERVAPEELERIFTSKGFIKLYYKSIKLTHYAIAFQKINRGVSID